MGVSLLVKTNTWNRTWPPAHGGIEPGNQTSGNLDYSSCVYGKDLAGCGR
jgi:hypothetical protein